MTLKNVKIPGKLFLVLVLAIIAGFLICNLFKHRFVERFSSPIIARNGSAFGPENKFTFSLDRNGTFIIDGKSGYAWEKSDSYRDSAIIRSTKPLPKTYKISVIIGDIDYGLDKIEGLQNDLIFRKGR